MASGFQPVVPPPRLDRHLREQGLADLAERFLDYRDAIDILKHGAGRSHDRRWPNARLDFRASARSVLP